MPVKKAHSYAMQSESLSHLTRTIQDAWRGSISARGRADEFEFLSWDSVRYRSADNCGGGSAMGTGKVIT